MLIDRFKNFSRKRISYILPTKNRVKYLEEFFSSIPALVNSDDELILIDGCSTDGTRELINKNSSLIDIYLSEADRSPAEAFNKGFLLANGRYIKILHDDDEFFPDAMEKAVAVMDKEPYIDVLLCGGTRSRQNNNYISDVYVPEGVNYGENVKNVFQYTGCGTGLFIRRSSLARIGIFDTTFVPIDIEFLARSISLGANVKFCRINMFHHIVHEHSSNVVLKDKIRNDMILLRKIYGIEFSPDSCLDIPGEISKYFCRVIGRTSTKKSLKKYQFTGTANWDGGFS